jgi:hypothetical protein
VALPDERYGGDDPSNLVNRISPCRGVQIEQGPIAREDHGSDIADVVATFFRPAAARPAWLRPIQDGFGRGRDLVQPLLNRRLGRRPR